MKKSIRICIWLCMCGMLIMPNTLYAQIYVMPNGNGSKTGGSWENAAEGAQLQTIITGAYSGSQIWVAAGEYQPAIGQSFSMKEGVKIYGGFAGTETSFSQRNLAIAANKSTLRGNGTRVIGNDSNGLSTAAVLDGFTITGGSVESGAGMLNYASSPYIANCVFTGNATVNDVSKSGGGMYCQNSSPVVVNCVFTGNFGRNGGGIACYNSQAKFYGCMIISNTAINGAALFANALSRASFDNCDFVNNTASSNSSAMYSSNASHPVIRNSIFYNNNVYLDGSSSSVDVSYSLTSYSGQGNISSSALFNNINNPDGDDDVFGTADDGLVLLPASPGINAGNNKFATNDLPEDLKGDVRIQSGWVDMGSYESNITSCNPAVGNTLYVNKGVTASGSGSTWDDAFKDLYEAMEAARYCNAITQIFVARGTYTPPLNASFVMKEGVKLYGGFVGNENLLSDRNWTINETILQGNGSHVIRNDNNGLTYAALLNGFTITGGNAQGYGGGMYNSNVYPALTNCIFKNNAATIWGGAMYNEGNAAPLVYNTLFYDNHATGGGAVFNNDNNTAGFINCTFANNTSSSNGGALHTYQGAISFVRNCIFWGNVNATGTQLYSSLDGAINADNCLIEGGNSAFTGSFLNVTGVTANPMFVDAGTGKFGLSATSPAVNKGGNLFFVGASQTTDLAGKPRLFGTTIDIGAYESQANAPLPVKLISFMGSISLGKAVKLDWQVSEQDDIQKYQVEQSVDGRNFVEAGSVEANNLDKTLYSFMDTEYKRFFPIEKVYYRLRIVEMDGTSEFSRIIAVHISPEDQIVMYPLPAKDVVWVKSEGQPLRGMQAQILNLQGAVLKKIILTQSPVSLDLTDMKPGVYLVRLSNGTVMKLMKE